MTPTTGRLTGFLMAISSIHFAIACDNQKNDHRFGRKYCSLTEVPKEIDRRADALEVQLDGNRITDIKDGTFSHLSKCKELSLSENKLTAIRKGMFRGLVSLDTLDLKRNKISSIKSGAFTDLPLLTNVNLENNQLKTFDNPFSKPSSGHISLHLSGNPLRCDSSLCWLKDAERDEWISLKDPKPTCEKPNALWHAVELDCTLAGNKLYFLIGGVVGGVILIVICVWCCCRKCKNDDLDDEDCERGGAPRLVREHKRAVAYRGEETEPKVAAATSSV